MLAFQTADRLDEFLPKFLHLHEFEQRADNYSKLELALLQYTKKVCDDPHTIIVRRQKWATSQVISTIWLLTRVWFASSERRLLRFVWLLRLCAASKRSRC